MPTLGFRLAIRNAADTADEVVISSVAGSDNPYLVEPPNVDGASADLLKGTCDVGSGTISFWDERTDVTLPTDAFYDGFAYADTTALDAAWPVSGGLPSGTATWSLATDRYVSPSTSLGLSLAGYGGVAGHLYRERLITGLAPGQAYTVSVRVWQSASGAAIQPGLWVAGGAGFQTTGTTAVGAWTTLTLTENASDAGTLLIRLDLGSDFANTTTREIRWDEVRIAGGTVDTTGRVMTARLHEVQDGVARLAVLSRAARIDEYRDGAWTPYHRGYLNRVEIDGGVVTVTVGDTTRREQQTELWATLPTLDPADVGLPMPAPRVGLILGGPIAADGTYGKFAAIDDYGPTRWHVEESLLDAAGDDRLVALKFDSGYLRPWYYFKTRFDEDEWEKTNNAGRAFFVWDPEKYQSDGAHTVNSFGYFPNLVARLTPVGGGAALERMPIARPVKHESGDKTKPKAEYSALTGNDSILYVDWGPDAFPSNGTAYDVTLYSPVISQDNPLLLAGHPVDLVAYAAALSDVPIDAAALAACKTALGDGLWCELAISGAQKFSEFQEALGGWFGFLLRPNPATGQREFVATRVRPASAQFTILNEDRLDAGGEQPLVWATEEDSVVNVVTFAQTRFRRFRYDEDPGDPPIAMMVQTDAVVEGSRGDTTVNGERTLRYELPGQAMVRAADGSTAPLVLVTYDDANPGYAEQAGGVIIDYAGWGVPETVVLLDAESPAASAQLGDEGTIDIPDMPVPTVGQTPVTARALDRNANPRVVRVVKRDPQPGSVQLTLVHAGELSQDAVDTPESGGSLDTGDPTVPEYTIAASEAAPTTVATVTLTNGADLADESLRTDLEYRVQLTAPTTADSGTAFGPVSVYPDGDATTIDVPAVPAGSTVWVKARSYASFSGKFSAWGPWVGVTLTVATGGESGVLTPVIAWTMSATGVVDATVSAPGAANVKLAGSPTAVPSDAAVRAGSDDASEPFEFPGILTLAVGQTGYLAAFAYDALGNESAKAIATVPRAASTPGDLADFPAQRVELLANAGRMRTIMPAFGSSPVEYDEGLRFAFDATGVQRVGLQGWVGRLAADAGATRHLGASGSRLVLAASLDGGTTFDPVDGAGALTTAAPALALDAHGLQTTAPATLDAAYRTGCVWTVYTRGGDGAARPWVGNVAVDFYTADVLPPDPDDPGDDACPPAFTDGFETYADLAALSAVWPASGGLLSGVATWTLTPPATDAGAQALGLVLVDYGGGPGTLERTHLVTGLNPSETYVVSCRAWQNLGGASIRPGMWTSGGSGFQTTGTDVVGEWVTLTLYQGASDAGTIQIRLVLGSDHGGTATRTVAWDSVTVQPICV